MFSLKRYKPASYVLRGVVALLVALLFSACNANCGDSSAPAASESTTQYAQALTQTQLSSYLPADVEIVLSLNELTRGVPTLKRLASRLGRVAPRLHNFDQSLATLLGVDLLTTQTWREAGFHGHSDLLVTMLDGYLVLLSHPVPRESFEVVILKPLFEGLEIEAPIQTVKYNNEEIFHLHTTEQKQAAWIFHEHFVAVVLPGSEPIEGQQVVDASSVISRLVDQNHETSLATTRAYKRSQQALREEHPVTLLFTPSYFENVESKEREEPMPEGELIIYDWLRKNSEGIALGLYALNTNMRVTIYGALVPYVLTTLRDIFAAELPSQWENFTTEDTILATRTNIDLFAIWSRYIEGSQHEAAQEIREFVEQLGGKIGVAIVNQILPDLTGNVVLFLYDANLAGFRHAETLPEFLAYTSLVSGVEFKSRDRLDAFVTMLRLATRANQSTPVSEEGEEIKDVQVLTFESSDIPLRLYIKENFLYVATSGVDEETVLNSLAAPGATPRIVVSSAGFNLKKDFARSDHFNGMFLNNIRAQRQISRLMPKSMQWIFFEFRESLLEFSVDDQGATATLSVDWRR